MADNEVQRQRPEGSSGVLEGWSAFWAQTLRLSDPSASSVVSERSASTGRSVTWEGQFPLRRGGLVVFALSATQPFTMVIMPSLAAELPGMQEGSPALGVRVDSCQAELVFSRGGRQVGRPIARSKADDAGYSKARQETFWLSLDADSRVLKYGKGSRMSERTLLQYDFGREGEFISSSTDRESVASCFTANQKVIQLADYDGPSVVQSTVYEEPLLASRAAVVSSVCFEELPLVSNPSPRLLEDHQMLLSDFTQEDFSFPANLPPTLQELSRKILQPWLSLESIVDSHGNVLNEAISHSLQTPGLTLHRKLQEKLRSLPLGAGSTAQISIALAPSQGNSPGPPVTLEILPQGYCGYPHDNARASGVLRVLQGNMDVLLFDEDLAQADEANPLDEVELERGDAFWFSANWYQTHAMRNVGTGFCCYLMARQYSVDDNVRWPHLRYKEDGGQICSCTFGADLELKEMQAAVMAELSAELQQKSQAAEIDSNLIRTASLRTQNWVDRTDSAMDYTAYFREGNREGKATAAEESRAHRFGCSPLRRSDLKPARDARFLLASPAIPEESRDLSTMWP